LIKDRARKRFAAPCESGTRAAVIGNAPEDIRKAADQWREDAKHAHDATPLSETRYYLIHVFGKVASQTLEATIRKSITSSARVERHHYLSDAALANLEDICRLPGIEADGIDGVTRQLTLARAFRADLDSCEPGAVRVLSGVRDPLDLSVAAFFQNLPTYCPWLDYNIEQAEYAADQLIEFFESEFDRMLSAKPPRNFQEALLNLKLGGPEKWFDEEFRELYDVDVCEMRMRRSEPFICFRNEKFQFLIYRTELLSSESDALLRTIGMPPHSDVKDQNVAREKEYSNIYRLFKQRFRPPSQMVDYYFGGRFSRNFYGE
jgi:Putative capsular polysaccharide synthesis protein